MIGNVLTMEITVSSRVLDMLGKERVRTMDLPSGDGCRSTDVMKFLSGKLSNAMDP
ncbi:hypothetical protein D3C71_2232790 [compost metagenome]